MSEKTVKRARLGKTIRIPIGTILESAPSVTQRNGDWYEVIIPIGKDHVAYLTLDADALLALRDLEPEISIS